MKRFSSELEELKKFEFMFENPVGGGGTTCVALPNKFGDTCNGLVEVTCGAEGTFPLGFGNFYEALDIVTPEGIGAVYNALEEVSSIGRGLWSVLDFCHPELDSGSHSVMLNAAKNLKNNKVQLIAPYKTYPLPLREGIKGRGVL